MSVRADGPASGGRRSRQKGDANERQLVLILRAHGMEAKRVPLSGSQEGYPGDVWADGLTFQAKVRADGFRELYRWLDGADVLALRADRKQWLVVQTLSDWLAATGRAVQKTGEGER